MINRIGQRFGRLINGFNKKSVRFTVIIFGAKNYNLVFKENNFLNELQHQFKKNWNPKSLSKWLLSDYSRLETARVCSANTKAIIVMLLVT